MFRDITWAFIVISVGMLFEIIWSVIWVEEIGGFSMIAIFAAYGMFCHLGLKFHKYLLNKNSKL